MATLRSRNSGDLSQGVRRTVKVLHLGKFDTLGGIERHVKALARGLARKQRSSGDEPCLQRQFVRLTSTCATVTRLSPQQRSGISLASLCRRHCLLARKLQRETQFDIVHLHFPDPLGHLTALSLPRSVKRVISWHSDIIRQQQALAVYGPFVRRFVTDADALIGATPQHLIFAADSVRQDSADACRYSVRL
jgi:hypothetical protein